MPDPDEIGIHYFIGDGDFRSEECIELLKQADIVVTNPPFSLFREYIGQLIKYDKKFLVLGNQNALHYKEIFPSIKDNKLWLGYTSPKLFRIPENVIGKSVKTIDGIRYQQFGNICWFTNLDIQKRHEDLILYKDYSINDYPYYDNYDAINVNKTSEIPMDYDGIMGVPISFLEKYNPDQFDIIGTSTIDMSKGAPYINGRRIYERILIRRKKLDRCEYHLDNNNQRMVAEGEIDFGKE